MPAPDATHLRRRAADLRRFAARLDDLDVTRLHLRAGSDTWVGPSPGACHDGLALAARWLFTAADELRASATRLERRAADLDAAARLATAGMQ